MSSRLRCQNLVDYHRLSTCTFTLQQTSSEFILKATAPQSSENREVIQLVTRVYYSPRLTNSISSSQITSKKKMARLQGEDES